MNSFTIKQKLYLAFALLILIFIATGIYAERSLNRINAGATQIATEHLQGVIETTEHARTLAKYRQNEFAVLTAGSLSFKVHAAQQADRLAQQIDIVFESAASQVKGDAVADFQDVRTAWNNYRKNSERVFQLVKENQIFEATRLVESSDQDYMYIESKLQKLLDGRKDFIHQENVYGEQQYQSMQIILISAIGAAVLLALLIAGALAKSISKPINNMMDAARKISQGDLSVEMKAISNDELGELTQVYGETVKNLRELIRDIQSTAEDVSNFASQLTENASQSAVATQQVATSIGNVAENANHQGEAVNRSTNSIKEMSEMLRGFEEKAVASSKAAGSVEEIAESGKTTIAQAVDQMSVIADSVMSSARVIQQLAERSDEIGQIVETISGISEQTNLLALNAAIEAARAGEAGRGFAVVADEVRKLAEGSGEAAQKIAEMIEMIQTDVKAAVQQMNQGTDVVEGGKTAVADAGKSFDNIAEAVENLAQHAAAILEDAKKSSDQVESLVVVMESLEKNGKDVAAETESVSAATEEQSASIDEVASASRRLSELAQELLNSTAKFKI
ncbi:MAG: methyl-accepting chemotaxis protein [Selenomonadaceae bacterium]|nr:methyl-accepting chemotaxis protein [Selenomonadaceae bacterium]